MLKIGLGSVALLECIWVSEGPITALKCLMGLKPKYGTKLVYTWLVFDSGVDKVLSSGLKKNPLPMGIIEPIPIPVA